MARTVLLADDSVTAQNMGRRILMDAGYEVITVNNGSAALKKIHESKPDLIVLDVYMPGYGGLEVCQRLKENPETQKIPVLLTVGKMEPFKTDEAKRVKADAHIVKPFDAGELLAALTKLEDRIVPASDGRGKSKPKKARMWHSEDPAKNFDDSNTEQIAYLAEVKKRQSENPSTDEQRAEAGVSTSLSEPPAAVVAPVTSAPEIPVTTQEGEPAAATLASGSVETPFSPEIPAPEFSVEQTSAVDYQIESTAAVDSYLPVEPEVTDAVSVPAPEATAPVETKSRWVAENVALSAEEASLELEREMQAAQAAVSASTSPETVAEPSSDPVPSSEVATAQPSPEAAGSAFAAAAAAGNSAVGTASISAEEPVGPSEAAAAWENWQHIRDSVMTPQTTAALAESVVEITQAAAPAFSEPAANSESEIVTQSPAPESAPETQAKANTSTEVAQSSPSGSSALEGEALASIVDSVLAELKPKLMQEIARKLKK